MPLGSWMKHWTSNQPPERNSAVMVAESLLSELDINIKDAEAKLKEREADLKRNQGGVDYSWLSATTPKPYEISQVERLELEELCLKVKPEECQRIMAMFRDAILSEPELREYPRIMRSIVVQVVSGRPKEDSIPEWISKSFTSLSKLRPLSRKITPVSTVEDDLEMQRSETTTVHSVSKNMSAISASLPNFYVTSDNMHV